MEAKINLPDELLEQMVQSIITTVPTDTIYIFGSFARGEETKDSDIDLYIVADKPGNNKIDYSAMADVGMALLWMNRPKDIICLSKDEFSRRSKRSTGLERMVAKEGVKIYERGYLYAVQKDDLAIE